MNEIRRVGVCGAGGTMGAGIAIVSARAGFETRCFDLSPAPLEAARRESKAFFEKSVTRGKLSAEGRDEALSRLLPKTRETVVRHGAIKLTTSADSRRI